MKKFLLIIFCTIFFPLSAFSATLKEALKQTFENNLELQAERKNLEIQQEVINMSRSDLLPSLTLYSTKNFEDTNKLFQNPEKVDFHITEWNEHNHDDVAKEILEWKK